MLKKISRQIEIKSKSFANVTGFERILRSPAMHNMQNFDKRGSDDDSDCNKDTEGIVTMNCYSRGHMFYVQPAGIIRYWNPLYKSEDPSQVALSTVKFLGLFVQSLNIVVLANIFLFYDNMCNLERLKIWDCDKTGLSLEARLGMTIFKRINKGVDGLHIRNHVRHSCRNEYPRVIQKLRETFTSPNTEAAEQTFLWLGKFKKIINSMDKRRHHFFLHCLVKERNKYTQYCLENKKKVVLPKLQQDKLKIAPLD